MILIMQVLPIAEWGGGDQLRHEGVPMPSPRRLIALGAVLVVAASGIALAETVSDHALVT